LEAQWSQNLLGGIDDRYPLLVVLAIQIRIESRNGMMFYNDRNLRYYQGQFGRSNWSNELKVRGREEE
jgi:hypothetical protein